MDWNKWSGFLGSGTYIILNKASLYALDLESNGDLVSLQPHTPHNPAQLWRISKCWGGEVYAIENVHHGAAVTSQGKNEYLFGNSPQDEANLHFRFTNLQCGYPAQKLWVIDKSTCALEPGNLVVFGSIQHPGFVLSQDSSGDHVILWQQEQEDDKGEREVQKWLIQKQEEEEVVLS